ncbi:MAG: hypothetical protein ACW964_17100 [Candidatus Hodarchaeales archaeon]
MRLYLGIVPGLFPWLKEPKILEKMGENQAGIIFSYWAFRRKKAEIISKGIHDFFSYDGAIMIDSGAYSAYNSGAITQIEEYLSFIQDLKYSIQDKDTIVNLDVIRNQNHSLSNWKYLKAKLNCQILPVIHFPNKKNDYSTSEYIGLGGMVPAFKINQIGSVYDVASWLKSFISSKGKRFHGFGVGSPYHQIAFDSFFSIDWIGWRRNAAVCSCYTPEGSIYIHEARKKQKKGKKMTQELFERYAPSFVDSYELLHKPGTEGWVNRALWNVWWFLIAKDFQNKIKFTKYVKNLRKRIAKD